jgi:hypothetical protein
MDKEDIERYIQDGWEYQTYDGYEWLVKGLKYIHIWTKKNWSSTIP